MNPRKMLIKISYDKKENKKLKKEMLLNSLNDWFLREIEDGVFYRHFITAKGSKKLKTSFSHGDTNYADIKYIETKYIKTSYDCPTLTGEFTEGLHPYVKVYDENKIPTCKHCAKSLNYPLETINVVLKMGVGTDLDKFIIFMDNDSSNTTVYKKFFQFIDCVKYIYDNFEIQIDISDLDYKKFQIDKIKYEIESGFAKMYLKDLDIYIDQWSLCVKFKNIFTNTSGFIHTLKNLKMIFNSVHDHEERYYV